MPGRYIVIEGQDGTGKSTQVELLAESLRVTGNDVIVIREPGGDIPATDEIRQLLKDKTYDLDPMTIVLLFAANRRELWVKVIEPALATGKTVISDRNWWSTIAYEHYGFGVPIDVINTVHKRCLPERYLRPDAAIILTLDGKTRRQRLGVRAHNSDVDTFESQRDDFQQRVIDGYLKIAKEYDVKLVDASGNPEDISQDINRYIK